MKKSSVCAWLTVAVMGLTLLSSCRYKTIKGSGHIISENRKVEAFDEIDISGGYKVKLKQDSSLSLNIVADDNLMKHIRTQVSGHKLRINSKQNLTSTDSIIISIGVRDLKEIQASGAIDIQSYGRINTKDFKLKFSGAGTVRMDMNAANVITDCSGATEVYLTGQAASNKVHLSGAGKLMAADFVVGDYKIDTEGATHCEVNVLKTLEVNSSGASVVSYRGNPSSVKNHKSGASTLSKIN